jgi:hypothetical protein
MSAQASTDTWLDIAIRYALRPFLFLNGCYRPRSRFVCRVRIGGRIARVYHAKGRQP